MPRPAIPVGIPLVNCSNSPARHCPPRRTCPLPTSNRIATAMPTFPTPRSASGCESSRLPESMTWPSRFLSVGPSISENHFPIRRRPRRATVNHLSLLQQRGRSRLSSNGSYRRQSGGQPGLRRISPKQIQHRNKPCSQPSISPRSPKLVMTRAWDTFRKLLSSLSHSLTDQDTASLTTQEIDCFVQLHRSSKRGWGIVPNANTYPPKSPKHSPIQITAPQLTPAVRSPLSRASPSSWVFSALVAATSEMAPRLL